MPHWGGAQPLVSQAGPLPGSGPVADGSQCGRPQDSAGEGGNWLGPPEL